MEASAESGPAVVLVHGLFGWGEARPLFGLAPTYFPMRQLRELWRHGPCVAVDVGIASSEHDRSCEAFAQLLGLRTDYGEEHSRRCEHPRFGRDYSARGGRLARWDAAHPVHLVGHSFGGTTVITLFAMIANDFWGLGTGPDWVLSVTSICGPLRGCSLPFALGLQPPKAPGGPENVRMWSFSHMLALSFCYVWKVQELLPWVTRLYDMKSDQWRPQATLRRIFMMNHPYWYSKDNMLSEITPSYRRRTLRAGFPDLSKTYLVAVVADSVEPASPAALATGAAACWCALALLLWRARGAALLRRARALLAPARARARGGGHLPAALLAAAGGAAAWLLALGAPGLQRRCDALAPRLQAALEPLRPVLHMQLLWFLRVSSYFVRKAANSLPVDCGLVAPGRNCGDNDGVIDVMSQRGLDVPAVRPGKRRGDSPKMRSAQSDVNLSVSRGPTLLRAFSHTDVAGASGAAPLPALERGKWLVVRVPNSNHCLGTWLSELSVGMYTTVFEVLERSTHGHKQLERSTHGHKQRG